ncbi:MAG: hypothetical protein GY719_18025 [bacterium]|nr:hypothetical protein [bacterium]
MARLIFGILLMCGGLSAVTIGGYLAKDGWERLKEKQAAPQANREDSFLMVVTLFGSSTPISHFFTDVSFINQHSKPATVKDVRLFLCDSPDLKVDPIEHKECSIIKWRSSKSITVGATGFHNEKLIFGTSREHLKASLLDSPIHHLGIEVSYLDAEAKSHRKMIPCGRLKIVDGLDGYIYNGSLPTSKNHPSLKIELL